MMRKILQSALLIFALSAIAYSIWSRGNDDSEQLTSATPATTEPAPTRTGARHLFYHRRALHLLPEN